MSTTVKKALLVLEALIRSGGPRGISDLSRELNLDKSAVQRVFQSLYDTGYLEKVTENGRYKPSLRIWEFGSLVIAQHEIRRLVHPIVNYAAKMSGLTAYFAWADFPDVVYIDKVEGERGRTNSSEPGRRVPMYLTASGKAVLAFMDEESVLAMRPQVESPGAADGRPAQSFTDLLDEMAVIRQRHYALSESGSMSKVNSIGAPVWANSSTNPIGSVALTSDASALPRADFERIGLLASTIAEQATRVLGGAFPTTGSDAP